MAQLGADVDQLDTIVRDFRTANSDLTAMIAKLDGSVNAAWWQGPDADQFRGDWSQQFKSQLNNVAAALDNTATAVAAQAQQQRDASGAG